MGEVSPEWPLSGLCPAQYTADGVSPGPPGFIRADSLAEGNLALDFRGLPRLQVFNMEEEGASHCGEVKNSAVPCHRICR